MGTRGLFGFYSKGKFFRVAYTQFDSNPESLGIELALELREAIRSDMLGIWEQKLEEKF